METMIDDLPPYVVPNSYPPKYNPRKVADYCREMGIEDPSTLTKEQLEPFRLKKSEVKSVPRIRGDDPVVCLQFLVCPSTML